ncbi:radical SAM protein [Ectothiorhodospiraceae bacterium BW-2]|nr:radical SAM protein [Ectothiorhodospiraceae bacterium BW-2]
MKNGLSILLLTSKSWAGFNISPPLGLYNLKTAVEAHNHCCEIFDYDIDDENLLKTRVKSGAYDIIGMSVTHVNMSMDLDAILELRQLALSAHDTLMIAGGQEATMNYEQWLRTKLLDICFLGFADKTFANFCDHLFLFDRKYHEGNSLSTNLLTLLQNTSGVAYLAPMLKTERVDMGMQTVYQPSPTLTREEFSELFYVNGLKNNIPYYRYWDIMRARKNNAFNNASFTVETTRLYTVSHCPRRCGFCSSQNFLPLSQDKKITIIMLSAQEVYELVEHYANNVGARAFMFSDDDFPVGNAQGILRLKEFCQKVIEGKSSGELPSDLQFFCQARVLDFLYRQSDGTKILRSELLQLMKLAGFHNIGLGIESFSERLLHMPSVNKIGVTLDDYRIVIDELLRLGITPQMFIIIGIPESTVEDLMDSITVATEYIHKGADVAVISTMRVYPGSPLTQNGDYPLVTKPWINPVTGQQTDILDFFIPENKEIAGIVDMIDEAAAEEQVSLKRRYGWSEDAMLSKSLIGTIQFIAVAKLLERHDVATRLYKMVDENLESSSYAA